MTVVVDVTVLVSLKRDSSVINTDSRYEPGTVYSFGHTGPVSVVPAIYIYTVLVASSSTVGICTGP